MRLSVVVQNDWCVFTEKVWSLLPQLMAQMVLQEIGVVLACDCPMLGHSMCEDAGIVVGENDRNLSIAGILPHFGFAGWPVMPPLIRLPFHFRLVSSRPCLIQRYDMMQECIPFLFLTFQMHPSRLISLPFLDFSQTVRDPTRCDFVHVQAFFENVQDRRMGQSGPTGQLPNCPPSICLQQCGHWTNLGLCCAGSSGPWLICRILPSSAEGLNPPCNCPVR